MNQLLLRPDEVSNALASSLRLEAQIDFIFHRARSIVIENMLSTLISIVQTDGSGE